MKLLNPRGFGMLCTATAVTAGLVLAGCANEVEGTPTFSEVEVTSYKAEASASSAAATSSRQAAAQAQSISDNCTPFRKTTGTAVDRYNEFVDAHDGNTADQAAKRDTAANALDDAARTVESQLTSTGGALPADLSKKFTDYVAAARALAGAVRQMSSTSNVGPLNDASRAVNDTLNAVRDACPAK